MEKLPHIAQSIVNFLFKGLDKVATTHNCMNNYSNNIFFSFNVLQSMVVAYMKRMVIKELLDLICRILLTLSLSLHRYIYIYIYIYNI